MGETDHPLEAEPAWCPGGTVDRAFGSAAPETLGLAKERRILVLAMKGFCLAYRHLARWTETGSRPVTENVREEMRGAFLLPRE